MKWVLKKFCGKCKKELPADSKYLLCQECHKRVVMAEDDREFYENSRLHY
jgi:Zn finger protein HypA/HybF involved in hydrogenase expression